MAMNLERGQKGITLTGLLLGCVVLGSAALLLMKLWPIYNEKFKVDQAMERLASSPEGARMSKKAMAKAIMRQFDVNDVDTFDMPRLLKTLEVNRKKGTKTKIVTMAYEIRGPLFGNLDVVMNYHKSIELGPPQTD